LSYLRSAVVGGAGLLQGHVAGRGMEVLERCVGHVKQSTISSAASICYMCLSVHTSAYIIRLQHHLAVL
jgi:hypothetical protein